MFFEWEVGLVCFFGGVVVVWVGEVWEDGMLLVYVDGFGVVFVFVVGGGVVGDRDFFCFGGVVMMVMEEVGYLLILYVKIFLCFGK